jgi:hypothetical protein
VVYLVNFCKYGLCRKNRITDERYTALSSGLPVVSASKQTTGLVKLFEVGTRYFWIVALAFLVNGLALFILFGIEARFEAITGAPVFDTQNELTRAQMMDQLPLYAGSARQIYWGFSAFDFVFPLIGSIFFALFYAYVLRRLPWTGWLYRKRVYLLVLLVALFDYMENIGFIWTLLSGVPPSTAAMQFALFFKQLKLLSLGASNFVALLLVGAFVAAWILRRQLPGIVHGD